MKKLIIILIAIYTASSCLAQSAYKLITAGKSQATIIRSLRTTTNNLKLANSVSLARNPVTLESFNKVKTYSTKGGLIEVNEVELVSTFVAPKLTNPTNLWGSYRYLRTITKLSRLDISNISDKYRVFWRNINKTQSYNGVHHIVSKNTISVIYDKMKEDAIKNGEPFTINLDVMQAEAPALLHPFHGNPDYDGYFHDIAKQLYLYEHYGMKGIVMEYFMNMQLLHWDNKDLAPFISADVVNGTLQETELWCKTFGLVWEK